MRSHLALLASLSLLAMGCTQSSLSARTAPASSLVLTPAVEAGALRTQATVSPYRKADINHLLVQLYTVANGTESPVVVGGAQVAADLALADLDRALTFDRLHSQTAYRVRAYAYSAAGTASANLISTLDSGSYADITVLSNDRPTFGSLPVRLKDKAFAATSSVRVSVTNPGATHHVGALLYRVTAGGLVTVPGNPGTIPVANLPGTFNLGSLAANATYRLVAQAENASNAVLATASVDVVTTTDTSAATKSLTINVLPPS